MEPALRIALSSLQTYNEKGVSGAEAFGDQTGEPFRLNITYSADIDRPGDRDTEAFVSGLKTAMSHGQEGAFGDQESEEGFLRHHQRGGPFRRSAPHRRRSRGSPVTRSNDE